VKLLLDTCTFLWLAEDDSRLSDKARELFQDAANQAFLSASSAWEISLKHALGKLTLAEPPEVFIPHMRQIHFIESLPVTEGDSIRAGGLPLLHRDPFDRLLVGQAIRHGCVLLTPDPLIQQYPVGFAW